MREVTIFEKIGYVVDDIMYETLDECINSTMFNKLSMLCEDYRVDELNGFLTKLAEDEEFREDLEDCINLDNYIVRKFASQEGK